jgi:hypothetical protein
MNENKCNVIIKKIKKVEEDIDLKENECLLEVELVVYDDEGNEIEVEELFNVLIEG